MNGNMDAVFAKIRALLNTKGRTEEEAAAYVAKAQELLQQYDLTIEAVQGNLKSDPRSSVGRHEGIAVSRRGKPDGWKVDLFDAVARACDCEPFYTTHHWDGERYQRGTFAQLVGRGSDIELTRLTFEYLVEELTRLNTEFGKAEWAKVWALAEEYGISKHEAERNYTRWNGTHPLKAKLSWMRGAVETVVRRLSEDKYARTHATSATNALVVNKTVAINEFKKAERAKARNMTIEEYDAYMADLRTKWAEQDTKRKPETDAQRRKREARERREYRRWQDRQYRQQEKIDRATDWDAYDRGRAEGHKVAIRRGLEG